MAITDAKATIGLPVGATNVLTSAGAAATVRYVPVGENLVTNGQFETDVTGWTIGTGATLTRDTGTFKIGAASMKIVRGSAAEAAIATDIAVYPGVVYVVGAWLNNNTATSIALDVQQRTSGGTLISSSQSTAVSTVNTWSFVTVRVTAAATAANISIRVSVVGASTNIAYIDGVTLQPCVPLAVSPYTVPTVIGDYAGGSFTYDVSPGAHYLGDVHVYDMDAQTDGTLARSSYTRVYDTRHTFTGDVLVDNGVMRLWFKTGVSATGNAPVRFSIYANGAWSTVQTVAVEVTQNTVATLSSITLNAVSGGTVTVTTVDSLSNTATWTLKRGAYAAKCVTARYSNSTTGQDFQINSTGIPQRFGVVNTSTVYYDDDLDTTTTYTTDPTEPYAVMVDDAYPYISAIGFAGMPGDVIFANLQSPVARYTTTATNGEQRTFWLIVMPWPWLTNGKYFVEAESATLGAGVVSAADAGASGGNVARLDAINEQVTYTAVVGRDIPLGHYTLVVRAKDSAQVASDLRIAAYNTTETRHMTGSPSDKTLTASYGYYTCDFELATADSGDTLTLIAQKITGTANTIDVDYFLIVPRKRNTDTPTHVHFPYDVAHDALMDTSTTHTIRKVT